MPDELLSNVKREVKMPQLRLLYLATNINLMTIKLKNALYIKDSFLNSWKSLNFEFDWCKNCHLPKQRQNLTKKNILPEYTVLKTLKGEAVYDIENFFVI